ncbi:MAG: phospholipase D-like domain-containing protein, partial [Thaumarchaeota archaeon]|nr:phospholipase D-like domain-containing protein [Nitrososphaerota archaeon]
MTVNEIRQDIIDNKNGSNMGDILNSVIANTDTFDVSTGYFDVKGYDVLRKTLEQKITDTKFHMRLLMGKEAILTGKDSFEKYAMEYGQDVEDSLSLKSSIDGIELTKNSRRGITGLINLLKSDNVEVKMSKKRFNHSKCYITKSAAFIGSSNFTAAGMAGNYELNAGIYSPLLINHTRDWFDSMWELGKPTKKELL